jgi:hypothetical protein
MPEQLFGLEMLQGGGQHTAASRVADAIMICVISAHWPSVKKLRPDAVRNTTAPPKTRISGLFQIATGQGLIYPRLCPTMKAEIEGMVEAAGGPDFLLQLRKVSG